jgi:hypothetical protein
MSFRQCLAKQEIYTDFKTGKNPAYVQCPLKSDVHLSSGNLLCQQIKSLLVEGFKTEVEKGVIGQLIQSCEKIQAFFQEGINRPEKKETRPLHIRQSRKSHSGSSGKSGFAVQKKRHRFLNDASKLRESLLI